MTKSSAIRPTRATKNAILCLSNALLWFVLVDEFRVDPMRVGLALGMWIVTFPLVAIFAARRLEAAPGRRPLHAVLFLYTGAAIGLIGGAAMTGGLLPNSLAVYWLPIGVLSALYHYLPGAPDDYKRGSSAG